MSLQSAMNTALSGIHYASTAISVYANNLANQQTDGFKESDPVAETQPHNQGVRLSAVQSNPSQGSIVDGVELSNTNIAANLLNLDTAALLAKSSYTVLKTTNDTFDSLLMLGRRWD